MHPHMVHFRVFLEMDKTACEYSLHIYDYLSQIQGETKEFLLIVRLNTEGPPKSDWQWRYWMLFFFVGSQNWVNMVLFFRPWHRLLLPVNLDIWRDSCTVFIQAVLERVYCSAAYNFIWYSIPGCSYFNWVKVLGNRCIEMFYSKFCSIISCFVIIRS